MNLLNLTRHEFCLKAKSFKQHKMFIAIIFVEVLLSLLTLICFYYIIKSKQMQKTWSLIGRDLKIIVFFGFVSYLIGTVNALLIHGYKFTMFVMDLDPCSYVWNGLQCFWTNVLYTIG